MPILVEAVAVFVRVIDILRMVGGIELAPHEDRIATKRIRFIQKTNRLENISTAKSDEKQFFFETGCSRGKCVLNTRPSDTARKYVNMFK